MAVTSKYQIENSPWTAERTKGVEFEDYKARITEKYERDKKTAKTE